MWVAVMLTVDYGKDPDTLRYILSETSRFLAFCLAGSLVHLSCSLAETAIHSANKPHVIRPCAGECFVSTLCVMITGETCDSVSYSPSILSYEASRGCLGGGRTDCMGVTVSYTVCVIRAIVGEKEGFT